MERQLGRGELKIDRFFRKVRVRTLPATRLRRVDPELDSFFNVNTPQDLQAARERLEWNSTT